jgi:hypothetical protein
MIGHRIGPYLVESKVGEGGPPPLALMGELRRDLAEANQRTRP